MTATEPVTAIHHQEFVAFPKIPRLRRDVLITEKIDGTNACVVIPESRPIYAQSRKRIITPESDNFGFAEWVHSRAVSLREILGTGRHYGEWWGAGIQRGYDKTEKRFSLFNVSRWANDPRLPAYVGNVWVDAVPVVGSGPMSDETIEWALQKLRTNGSLAAPGFSRPEGIIVFHKQSGLLFKVLLENDDTPKGNNEDG